MILITLGSLTAFNTNLALYVNNYLKVAFASLMLFC
jgi:hypothetical protein